LTLGLLEGTSLLLLPPPAVPMLSSLSLSSITPPTATAPPPPLLPPLISRDGGQEQLSIITPPMSILTRDVEGCLTIKVREVMCQGALWMSHQAVGSPPPVPALSEGLWMGSSFQHVVLAPSGLSC
jgi:hypothetical protein